MGSSSSRVYVVHGTAIDFLWALTCRLTTMIYHYQHIQIPEAVNAKVKIPEDSEIVKYLVIPSNVGVDHLWVVVRVNQESDGYDTWRFSTYIHGLDMNNEGREEYIDTFLVNRQLLHLYGYKTFD